VHRGFHQAESNGNLKLLEPLPAKLPELAMELSHVAWVPERTFLDPSTYPNAGVIDWTGAHWQATY